MILAFLLCTLVSSKLSKGDSPYKILGLSSSANKSEIKKAYRVLTLKYHPDLNKKEDTTKKWIRVNDAYEILADPDRKTLYDIYGIVDENDALEVNAKNPFAEYSEHYFGKKDNKEIEYSTPLITKQNYDNFVREKKDCLILVFSSFMCPICDEYQSIFESFSVKMKKLCKCGRIDVATNKEFALSLGADVMPCFLYIKNKTIKSILKTKVSTVHEITNFIASHWGGSIITLSKDSDFQMFLKYNIAGVKIIQFSRSKEASLVFKRIASMFPKKAAFAVFIETTVETARKYNITSFPSVIVYRNPILPPIKIESTNQLTDLLLSSAHPTLFRVDQYSMDRYCHDFCYIRCGYPDKKDIPQIAKVTQSTGVVSQNSSVAAAFKLNEGDWVALFPLIQLYTILKKGENETSGIDTFSVDMRANRLPHKDIPPNFKVDWIFDAWYEETVRFSVYAISYLINPVALSIIFVLILIIFFLFRFIESRKSKSNIVQKPHKD